MAIYICHDIRTGVHGAVYCLFHTDISIPDYKTVNGKVIDVRGRALNSEGRDHYLMDVLYWDIHVNTD
jgi:hypothetical protein